MTEHRLLAEIAENPRTKRIFHNLSLHQRREVLKDEELQSGELTFKKMKRVIARFKRKEKHNAS